MLVNEVLTPQREVPLHLKTTAPGTKETFKSRQDFDAAIMSLPNPKPKKVKQDSAVVYYVNKKDQIVAKWDGLEQRGFVVK